MHTYIHTYTPSPSLELIQLQSNNDWWLLALSLSLCFYIYSPRHARSHAHTHTHYTVISVFRVQLMETKNCCAWFAVVNHSSLLFHFTHGWVAISEWHSHLLSKNVLYMYVCNIYSCWNRCIRFEINKFVIKHQSHRETTIALHQLTT